MIWMIWLQIRPVWLLLHSEHCLFLLIIPFLYIDTHPIYNNPAQINIYYYHYYYYYYYYYQYYYIIIDYWMISLVSLGTPYLFRLFSNNLLISIEYWVWSWSICSSLGLVTCFTCIGEPTEDKERDITL